MKILLVDDDKFLLELYSGKFREAGFAVEIAHGGREALEKTQKTAYDAILLDIVMPVVDGYEVLRELGARGTLAKTAVVIHSNLGERNHIARGKALGARDYLVKSAYMPREVVEKVSYYISQQS